LLKSGFDLLQRQAKASQEAAALVVNSIGQMIQPKRDTRKKYAFDEAIDLVANGFKSAREAKRVKLEKNEQSKLEKPEAKTLAQLLVEAQDSE
jgi:hypothetical protein